MGDIMNMPVTTTKQLAIELKGRRKALKLTQKELAGMTGLLPKTISALESDPDRCSVKSLRILLAGLQVEMTLAPAEDLAARVRAAEW